MIESSSLYYVVHYGNPLKVLEPRNRGQLVEARSVGGETKNMGEELIASIPQLRLHKARYGKAAVRLYWGPGSPSQPGYYYLEFRP